MYWNIKIKSRVVRRLKGERIFYLLLYYADNVLVWLCFVDQSAALLIYAYHLALLKN